MSKDTTVDLNGHDENHTWDSGKVTTQPSHTSTGVRTYACTICGATKTESIPKLVSYDYDYTPSTTTTPIISGTETGTGTTTVTDPATGTVTETTTNEDGSSTVVETQRDGTVTTTDTAANGVETVTVDKPGEAIAVTVTLPEDVETATVTIPCEATNGLVAMDAETGEIVKLSVPTEDGLTVVLTDSANLILVDNSKDFDDVDGDYWGADAINFVAAREIFNGTGDGKFDPEEPMSRGMVAQVLYNLDTDAQPGSADTFDDVSGDAWYADAVNWAAECGIVSGTGDGNFNAGSDVTREQLITILYHYAQLKGYDVSGTADLSDFSDADGISEYASGPMAWAVSCGLISGMGDGTLNPGGPATRAQVAAMMENFCKNVVK
jgi:hypothetical protein